MVPISAQLVSTFIKCVGLSHRALAELPRMISVAGSHGPTIKAYTSGTLNLSVIDRVIRLRKALSKALVPYYPSREDYKIRDDDDDNGEGLHISCTGEGVWFVEALCKLLTCFDLNYLDEAPQGTQEKLIPDPFPKQNP
ncbi:hypothetical protein Syun_006377 [Stephania yunnanensis]|uniref:Uncharacterized protein n=1 Tax=Stephania yunnanensis TaxID=152371 RepID=A0AAP0KWS3_9MAGN